MPCRSRASRSSVGMARSRRLSQVERHAAEQSLVIGDVRLAQLRSRSFGGGVDLLLAERAGSRPRNSCSRPPASVAASAASTSSPSPLGRAVPPSSLHADQAPGTKRPSSRRCAWSPGHPRQSLAYLFPLALTFQGRLPPRIADRTRPCLACRKSSGPPATPSGWDVRTSRANFAPSIAYSTRATARSKSSQRR